MAIGCLKHVILIHVMDMLMTSVESANEITRCTACYQATWPQNTWECDLSCRVAPTGALTYGE